MDTNEVIMWLKPVGEARVDVFWRKFSFPPNIWVSFPSLGPHFVDRMNEDCGGMNFIYWPEIDTSEGLMFPLLPLIH